MVFRATSFTIFRGGGYISIEKNPDDRRQIIIVPLIDIDDSKNEGNLEILDLTFIMMDTKYIE